MAEKAKRATAKTVAEAKPSAAKAKKSTAAPGRRSTRSR
jgi:hypothetical protein